MKKSWLLLWVGIMVWSSCSCGLQRDNLEVLDMEISSINQLILPGDFSLSRLDLEAEDIQLTKELCYDRYTLKDEYPYQDTVRSFKWTVVKKCLAFVENLQQDSSRSWAILSNYKNRNGEAVLVKSFFRNEYGRVCDTLGVERYQSVPLYLLSDTLVPVRYGRDGTLVRLSGEIGNFYEVEPATVPMQCMVPRRYIRKLSLPAYFYHVIVIDRTDQNIVTLEHIQKGKWKIRSMNPATTGLHKPPYAQETPLGLFVLQEKKEKMNFLKDGKSQIGGYAPYASRFTNGAYIHGVPVNVPYTEMVEYSWSLGTTPKSHMCVRVATSHAKFIFDWAPVYKTLIIVIG